MSCILCDRDVHCNKCNRYNKVVVELLDANKIQIECPYCNNIHHSCAKQLSRILLEWRGLNPQWDGGVLDAKKSAHVRGDSE